MLSEADFFGGLEEDRRLFENVLSATNVAVKRKKVGRVHKHGQAKESCYTLDAGWKGVSGHVHRGRVR